MGGEEAEGPTRAMVHADEVAMPAEQGFVGRRARRSRAHEYWSARPWAVREEERAALPTPRPVPTITPLPQRSEPVGTTAAGLPMRVAPGLAQPVEDDGVIQLPRSSGEVPTVRLEPVPDPVPSVWPAPIAADVPEPGDDAPLEQAADAPAAEAGDVDEALEMLVELAPHLECLASAADAAARVTYARCQGMLARMGRAVSDRRVWRALLALCDADPDPEVRAEADAALIALEQHGTVPRA
ncbi:hypothetical protein [Demequina soli]|uniref:hypothetical protein n=1 Tax=Demequina soli TaxID=1638987 RepID=UPI000A89D3BD|nr:hypothetical protein [Demequina soli]